MGAVALASALALVACAVPGRRYEVSPAVSGTVQGEAGPAAGARIVLSVHYPENPVLGVRREAVVAPDGSFQFGPESLALAGKEYSKHYRLLLALPDGVRPGDAGRTLWRADYARTDLGPPVRLDCDLRGPPSRGPACWPLNGVDQPWLVEAGRRDFRRLCSPCHGRDGLGDGPASLADGQVPPDLTTLAERRGGVLARRELAEWIDGRLAPAAHGPRTMPVWGELLEREYPRSSSASELAGARIDTIVTFLKSIQPRR